jgi:hypothetical protein
MNTDRLYSGYIKMSADAEPRPLTATEAQQVFEGIAAKGNEIAFQYLQEGCECRAQLMIEYLEGMGIDPGRVWALAVGRDLTVAHPTRPRAKIKWRNHTAPIVAVKEVEDGVLVIDPSLSGTGPLTVSAWAAAMRAHAIVISEVPLAQVQILEMQRVRALAGQDLDAVVFRLARGQAPIPEIGGSGFRIDADPPQGVSAFAHAKMQGLLVEQRKSRPGRGPKE